MKKILILILILCFTAFCIKDMGCVEGTVIKKTENYFSVNTNTNDEIIGSWPEGYDNSLILIGDSIYVYYNGVILESSPRRIRDVINIVKK